MNSHGLTWDTPIPDRTDNTCQMWTKVHPWSIQAIQWPCTIEIAWVDLGRPDPGCYKREILVSHGQKRRLWSTQSCTANCAWSMGKLIPIPFPIHPQCIIDLRERSLFTAGGAGQIGGGDGSWQNFECKEMEGGKISVQAFRETI